MSRMRPAGTAAEAAVLAVRAGRMVVVRDDHDRQDEGDLVLAAELVTPEAIAFMAREGRGLIALALAGETCDRLGLAPMTPRNECRFGRAFTVSVEARDGVSTGISAADRARTIAVACDPRSRADDLVRPGHVFPLRARPGGVVERRGHTEAAVDLARLAGLAPAGVICQVLADDGTLARGEELVRFSRRHRLPLVTVAELAALRRRAAPPATVATAA